MDSSTSDNISYCTWIPKCSRKIFTLSNILHGHWGEALLRKGSLSWWLKIHGKILLKCLSLCYGKSVFMYLVHFPLNKLFSTAQQLMINLTEFSPEHLIMHYWKMPADTWYLCGFAKCRLVNMWTLPSRCVKAAWIAGLSGVADNWDLSSFIKSPVVIRLCRTGEKVLILNSRRAPSAKHMSRLMMNHIRFSGFRRGVLPLPPCCRLYRSTTDLYRGLIRAIDGREQYRAFVKTNNVLRTKL